MAMSSGILSDSSRTSSSAQPPRCLLSRYNRRTCNLPRSICERCSRRDIRCTASFTSSACGKPMRVDQDADGNWIVLDGDDTVIRSPIFKTNEDAWRWVDRHDHSEWIE